jgi:hypothetical protein
MKPQSGIDLQAAGAVNSGTWKKPGGPVLIE